jgi:hypothetical protein
MELLIVYSGRLNINQNLDLINKSNFYSYRGFAQKLTSSFRGISGFPEMRRNLAFFLDDEFLGKACTARLPRRHSDLSLPST